MAEYPVNMIHTRPSAVRGPRSPEWRSEGDWSRVPRPQPSIVEYTDAAAPRNEYPQRIISPSHPRACCDTDMANLGLPERDRRWVYQYSRCRTCGFTVRRLVATLPDEAALANIRQVLARAFNRWNGEPG